MAMTRTLTTTIEGIGQFTFKRRTMRDEIAIGAAQERLTEGQDVSEGFRRLTYMLAALEVLTIEAPDTWDLMRMDPLAPDAFERIGLVYGGLREAEDRFRSGASGQPQGSGPDPGEVA